MFPKRNYDFNYQLPASVSSLTSLDDIRNISPFFTQTNPVTYAIFLQANENKLSDYEISQTKSLMNHLIAKEEEAMKAISAFLKDKREYDEITEVVNDTANNIVLNIQSSSLDSSLEESSS